MPSEIYVSPGAATKPVISVGGVCYQRVDTATRAPNVTSVDDGFDDCPTCSTPAPCSCPEGMPSTMTAHITAGSFTITNGQTHTLTWDAQDITLAPDSANPPCGFVSERDAFVLTTDPGTTIENARTGTMYLQLMPANAASGCVNQCHWLLFVTSIAGIPISFYPPGPQWWSARGTYPNLGQTYHPPVNGCWEAILLSGEDGAGIGTATVS